MKLASRVVMGVAAFFMVPVIVTMMMLFAAVFVLIVTASVMLRCLMFWEPMPGTVEKEETPVSTKHMGIPVSALERRSSLN